MKTTHLCEVTSGSFPLLLHIPHHSDHMLINILIICWSICRSYALIMYWSYADHSDHMLALGRPRRVVTAEHSVLKLTILMMICWSYADHSDHMLIILIICWSYADHSDHMADLDRLWQVSILLLSWSFWWSWADHMLTILIICWAHADHDLTILLIICWPFWSYGFDLDGLWQVSINQPANPIIPQPNLRSAPLTLKYLNTFFLDFSCLR